MNLEQGAPKLKNHWLHRSGGLLWHLRALRYRDTLWQPFRLTVAQWLQHWQPPADKLLVVGPSAGYTLNPAFLQRWREVVVLEPDPLARMLLRRRYLGVNWRFENWDVLSVSAAPLAHNLREHAVLFANVIGQVAPRTEAESNHWMRALRLRLARTHWASYHDVMSTTRPPDLAPVNGSAQASETLDEVLEHFWRGGALEIVDHGCFGLGGKSQGDRAYCVWPMQPGHYHLVEWLTGAPAQPE